MLFQPFLPTSCFSVIVAFASVPVSVMAQYGASPSQTGTFFDDLRQRASQSSMNSSSDVRSGEAVYDYERGSYTTTSYDERQMGGIASAAMANDAARQMGQPAVRSGSNAFAARSVGDYTFYSGQYATPSTFFAPTYVSDPFLGGRRNIRVGPANFGFGLYGAVEYNDNVTRSSQNPVDDFIATTLLNVDANWQITQNNRLTLTTALGFDTYINNPDLAPYGSGSFVLNVLPGSTIAFDIKIGPVFIVIYDRVAVRPAVRNDFALAANQIFGAFQNDAGLAAMWDINSALSLSVNYLHSTSRALQTQFERFDRDMDSIHGNLTWSPDKTWALGIEGGLSWVNYLEEFNNDGRLANVGLVFSTPIGKSTYLRASLGVQNFKFDQPPTFNRTVSEGDIMETNEAIAAVDRTLASGRATSVDEVERLSQLRQELADLAVIQGQIRAAEDAEFVRVTRDTSDLSDYYYNVTVTNQLNARVNHTLSFGHESALNNISNYITADYVNYGIGVIAWRGSRLSMSGYFEDATMSGGLQAEDLTQYGLDIYLSHQLSSTVRMGLGYHHGITDSNLVNRDFVQDAFSFDLSYALSRRATISLGYRYFVTAADDELNDFDQNRIVFAFNYNF